MKATRPIIATEEIDNPDSLDYYMELPYEINITPDECNDRPCYMASHPELFGCMAQGNTPEEALSNLRTAREDYITTLLEEGAEVPLPRKLVAR